jgi:hypothetical protein
MRVRDLATFGLGLCLVVLFFMPPLGIILLGLFFPLVLIMLFFASIFGFVAALFDRK